MKKLLTAIAVFGLVTAVGVAGAQSTFAMARPVAANAYQTANSLATRIARAQITAVNATANTLTIVKGGKTITVNVNSNTSIIRKYLGKSNLSQLSVGDMVDVFGTWTDSSKTTVNASRLRDYSIQEKHDTFFGSATSVNASGLSLQSRNRGSQTVNVTSATKIVNKNGQVISLSSVNANDHLRVDGMWDHASNTITATRIRDFSR